jgi:hypothetical protein
VSTISAIADLSFGAHLHDVMQAELVRLVAEIRAGDP